MRSRHLPHRSAAVPELVAGFQRRSIPELDSLAPGGVVLSGMGGVGKTQAAADHATWAWESGELALVGWVTATNRATVIGALAELGAVVTGAVVDDADQGAQHFLDWCATTGTRWLVVFDDVDDPAELAGLWPSTSGAGRLVVTTRRDEPWVLRSATRVVVPVDVFTEDESLAYLRGALDDVDGAGDLAAVLGHLPLALGQAAAYITMVPGMTCHDYLAKWHDQRTVLAELFPHGWTGADGYVDTVATTWSISIEAADRLDPTGMARPLLGIVSLLDPNGIPLSVLTSGPVCEFLSKGSNHSVDAGTAARALGCLRRLSLVSTRAGDSGPVVRAHALVQQATREQLPAEWLEVLVTVAADALVASWPSVERDVRLGAVLRANAAAVAERGGPLLWRDGCHNVLFVAAGSLGESGQVHAAITRHEELHAAAAHHLGADHPDTMALLNNAAHWHVEAGQHEAAARILTALLTSVTRVFGADHPNTLTTRDNLGRATGRAGDAEGAAELSTDLLADRLRVLGPDHPDTLIARNNVAAWRGKSGDAAGAIRALTDLVRDQTRVIGADHPHTLITRNNLAKYVGIAGDTPAAILAFTELLTDQLRALGPDHPDTLTTRHELARSRGDAGDVAGAIEALTELADDQLRVLGPDHPESIVTRETIANLRARRTDH
ncbi:tetratricopeptide repeat protein [Actinokineospora globicatena]|uniref:Tetratricopeptide repeat-containing protein n=1 Tax=Actinokineospora globicatena TaxID=103729 RepID=A0A9W6QPV3_9PSEU|nr:tetratricopeptide repeat protein [Actinokineospora globicatena]GLW93492.1 hypothetical protein Aglo03_43080 [Actinokineospora globicatena]